MGGKYEGNVNFKVASICFDSRLIFNETNEIHKFISVF